MDEEDRLDDSLRELLDAVADGRLSAAEAGSRLTDLGVCAVGDYARLDLGRARRKHVPEIVYAPGKTVAQLVEIVAAFVRGSGAVLCQQDVLRAGAGGAGRGTGRGRVRRALEGARGARPGLRGAAGMRGGRSAGRRHR